MTTGEAIKRVNDLKPNTYTDQMKIAWLSELDGKIFQEVILTHEVRKHHHHHHWPDPLDREDDSMEEKEHHHHHHHCEFKPYKDLTDELIVPFPHAGDVYTFYLMSQIDLHNAETAKYNQSIVLFNAAYQTYSDWYNRTHKPISHGRRISF